MGVIETWYRLEIVFRVSEKRAEVKNSLTEKCENCITWDFSVLARESNVEHVDSTASTGSSRR